MIQYIKGAEPLFIEGSGGDFYEYVASVENEMLSMKYYEDLPDLFSIRSANPSFFCFTP